MCFNKLHSEFRVQACCFVFSVESPSFQVKALDLERAAEVSPMDGLGWFWFLFVSESIAVPEDAVTRCSSVESRDKSRNFTVVWTLNPAAEVACRGQSTAQEPRAPHPHSPGAECPLRPFTEDPARLHLCSGEGARDTQTVSAFRVLFFSHL